MQLDTSEMNFFVKAALEEAIKVPYKLLYSGGLKYCKRLIFA